MKEDTKTGIVLTGRTIVFLGLTIAFLTGALDRERPVPTIVMVDQAFVDKTPVRANFARLEAADEDTSDYSCYACHTRGERVELKFDAIGDVIIEEHDYITFKHGPTHDNNYCFNCHDYDAMNRLRTRHQTLTFEESNLLCASCHGTTYRDWLANAHGRTSGYWNLAMGDTTKLDCTECHDPHDTRFPSLNPAPGPHSLKNRIIVNGTE